MNNRTHAARGFFYLENEEWMFRTTKAATIQ
jgi:hypothetical protein